MEIDNCTTSITAIVTALLAAFLATDHYSFLLYDHYFFTLFIQLSCLSYSCSNILIFTMRFLNPESGLWSHSNIQISFVLINLGNSSLGVAWTYTFLALELQVITLLKARNRQAEILTFPLWKMHFKLAND